eukprot:83012-Chlamydomonas_euryale.AAC.3
MARDSLVASFSCLDWVYGPTSERQLGAARATFPEQQNGKGSQTARLKLRAGSQWWVEQLRAYPKP